MKPLLALFLSCLVCEAAPQKWLPFLYQGARISPTPDYTGWLQSGTALRITALHDTFGGPAIFDPATGQYYCYLHDDSASKIYRYTSTDGANWSGRTLALDVGSAGAWDDTEVGVPFTWYENGESRPWRMMYRGGHTGSHVSIGLCTSLDGVTWERKDPAGNTLNSPRISSTVDIDFGNVFRYGGTYYLYWNPIGIPRYIYLSTSTDLVTWTAYGAPDPIFSPVADASNDWDYDDRLHASDHADAAYSSFCGWYGYWPDGSSEPFRAYLPSYKSKSGTNGINASLCCFSSSSPIFLISNRTFRGWVFDTTTTKTVDTVAFGNSGMDVPRIQCDDITQQPLLSVGLPRRMWISALLAGGDRMTYLDQVRGIEVPTEGTSGWTLSNCSIALSNQSPVLTLSPTNTSSTLFLWCPGRNLTLNDLSGYGVAFRPYGTWTLDANGYGLAATGNNYLVATPAIHYSQFDAVSNNWTIEITADKSTACGNGNIWVAFALTGGAGLHIAYLYLQGSTGDTAVKWNLTLTDTGGSTRNYATAAFDWSDNARRSFMFSCTGGKVYWHQNGTLQNSGGTAFNYTIKAQTGAIPIHIGSDSGGSTYFWRGHIDEIRYSSVGLQTSDYVVSPLSAEFSPNGTAFSRVYDFRQTVTGCMSTSTTTPTGCSITIKHRLASSTTDKSVTIGDFTTDLTTRGRYHQWSLELSGPGSDAPTISSINIWGRP